MASVADDQEDLLSPDEIEALIQAARDQAVPPPEPPRPSAAPPAGNDVLDPNEIEALLAAAQPGPMTSPPASRAGNPRASDPDAGSPRPRAPEPSRPATAFAGRPEQLLQSAESHLAAAVSNDYGGNGAAPNVYGGLGAGEPRDFAFEDFGGFDRNDGPKSPMQLLNDVELELRIELGRAELLIEDVLKLRDGSVVPLDKLAGDPVDILVNGRLIARGEVLVLNDNFCVRVAEILTPED